jgi:hypothetical protein
MPESGGCFFGSIFEFSSRHNIQDLFQANAHGGVRLKRNIKGSPLDYAPGATPRTAFDGIAWSAHEC